MTDGLTFHISGLDEIYKWQNNFKFRMRQLFRHEVFIGALRAVNDKSVDFMQMICAVQNRGCTIKPVNTKYLTIPTPNAHGKRAGDFGKYSQGNPTGLFFHIAKTSGKPTLARNVDGQLQVVFLLSKQVNIPARGFIDITADECMDHVNRIVDDEIYQYSQGRSNYIRTLNLVGRYVRDMVIAKIQATDSPPNANITAANKGMNNPLVDTGDLQKSITWVIV